MERSTFLAQDGAVIWNTEYGPVRLNERQRETLLDMFLNLGSARLFNALHHAHAEAGGVERVSPFRRVA